MGLLSSHPPYPTHPLYLHAPPSPFQVSYRIGSQGSICHTAVAADTNIMPSSQSYTAMADSTTVSSTTTSICTTSGTGISATESATLEGASTCHAPSTQKGSSSSESESDASGVCATPPPSPARCASSAPRSPLLPLPLTKRPSENGFPIPSSPPVRRSMSRDYVVASPPTQRRTSLDASMRSPMLGRSPSRVDVYIRYDELQLHGTVQPSDGTTISSVIPSSFPIPPSPRRRSTHTMLDLTANAPYPMLLSH